MEEKGEKSILDIIAEHGANERLDAILFRDPEFQKLECKIGKEMGAFSRLGLSKKERFAAQGDRGCKIGGLQ